MFTSNIVTTKGLFFFVYYLIELCDWDEHFHKLTKAAGDGGRNNINWYYNNKGACPQSLP